MLWTGPFVIPDDPAVSIYHHDDLIPCLKLKYWVRNVKKILRLIIIDFWNCALEYMCVLAFFMLNLMALSQLCKTYGIYEWMTTLGYKDFKPHDHNLNFYHCGSHKCRVFDKCIVLNNIYAIHEQINYRRWNIFVRVLSSFLNRTQSCVWLQ
jgi:hypothetical protein